MAEIGIGDEVFCHKCRRTGKIGAIDNGGFMVIHGYEWRDVESQSTGIKIKCQVMSDSCRDVKISSPPPKKSK